MKKLLVVLAVIALLPVTPAQADSFVMGDSTNWVSIVYGATNHTVGGGSFDVSTLNGAALPWVYCVDLDHYISLRTTYPNTLVRHDGYVNGSEVNNAAKVAWLLDTYATDAAGNSAKEAALQGLIWKAIYGDKFTFSISNPSYGQYAAWMPAAFGSGDVSKYSWLTPDSRCLGASCPAPDCIQGQVTYQAVPDAGSTALLLGAALAGLAAFRRSR